MLLFFYWFGHSWLPLPLLLFIVSPKFWGFGCSSRFGWVRSRLVWLCGLTGSAVSAAWAGAAHQVTETSAPSSERSKTMTEYPATIQEVENAHSELFTATFVLESTSAFLSEKHKHHIGICSETLCLALPWISVAKFHLKWLIIQGFHVVLYFSLCWECGYEQYFSPPPEGERIWLYFDYLLSCFQLVLLLITVYFLY